jgi:chemosensory pili system protein ChpA (sensor histidine kinase/response regulator)
MTTILVADDSATMRSLLELNLKKVPGVRIVLAKDGADALQKLEAEKPSLVLTDLHMPNMSGFDFIEQVRRVKLDQATPIIIVTTRDEAESRQRGMDLGANAYVCKPINGVELVQVVESWLAKIAAPVA